VASLKPMHQTQPAAEAASAPDVKNGRLFLPRIQLKNLIAMLGPERR